MKKSLGNNLSEYLLPIVFLGLPALLLVSQVLNSPDTTQGLGKQYQAKVSVDNPKQFNLTALGHHPGLSTLKLTLENGKVITIPEVPASQTSYLETIGVSGNNEKLMAALESLARQLHEQGEITEEKMNELIALAKQGYRIGNAQKTIENLLQSGTFSKNEFYSTALTFDGKTFTPYTLANQFGLSGPGYEVNISPELLAFYRQASEADGFTASHLTGKSASAGKEMDQFIKLYQQAMTGNGITSDIAKTLISKLVGQVLNHSESFDNIVNYTSTTEFKNSTEDKKYTVENITQNIAEHIQGVYKGAKGICDVGSGQEGTTAQAGLTCVQ